MIARRAISGAGELPGYDTGAMSRSIKVKTRNRGLYAVVSPHKTAAMGDDYYPAFLIYGTKRGLKKRMDFIHEAFLHKQLQIRLNIRNAVLKAFHQERLRT